jgi:hypothetical protein
MTRLGAEKVALVAALLAVLALLFAHLSSQFLGTPR